MPIKRKRKIAKPAKAALEIFDIAIEDLIPDEANPNEMDAATMDALVEEIREQGFDEPLQVRAHPTMEGKYQIGSGHHRTKAATILGFTHLPCVIKEWSDREQKVALTKRNVLRGNLNKAKLTSLYRDLAKGKDGVQVQRELGFTNPKKFEAMIEQVEKNLTPSQRTKLREAKETIKSVDDLSSVLNKIFKDNGSELDHGYAVFSFGGKKHHYFQTDDATNAKLEQIVKACEERDISASEFMQSIIAAADLPAGVKAATKKPAKAKSRKRKPKE